MILNKGTIELIGTVRVSRTDVIHIGKIVMGKSITQTPDDVVIAPGQHLMLKLQVSNIPFFRHPIVIVFVAVVIAFDGNMATIV